MTDPAISQIQQQGGLATQLRENLAWLESAASLCEKIDQLRDEVLACIELATHVLGEGSAGVPAQERSYLIRRLYWGRHTVKYVRSHWIAVGFGLKESSRSALARAAAPAPRDFHFTCGRCHGAIVPTSRYKVGELSKELKKNGPEALLCRSCRDEDRSRRDEESAEFFRSLEARSSLDLVALPYQEYLQSEHWQTVRRSALEAAGWQCELCGADYIDCSLEVHHKTYERRGRELPGDLQVLCADCHRSIHGLDEGNRE